MDLINDNFSRPEAAREYIKWFSDHGVPGRKTTFLQTSEGREIHFDSDDLLASQEGRRTKAPGKEPAVAEERRPLGQFGGAVSWEGMR